MPSLLVLFKTDYLVEFSKYQFYNLSFEPTEIRTHNISNALELFHHPLASEKK